MHIKSHRAPPRKQHIAPPLQPQPPAACRLPPPAPSSCTSCKAWPAINITPGLPAPLSPAKRGRLGPRQPRTQRAAAHQPPLPPPLTRPHTTKHLHPHIAAQQQHSSTRGTASTAASPALPPGHASPSGAANQPRAHCRPRCHAHSATSHHRHAKHNSSIATLQQQRPNRQGTAHSQPPQLARTPPLLARHPHFIARAACGQGSTQTATWRATLQLGEHAATRNNPLMAAPGQQQAAHTWHPAAHLLLAANTAAALHAAAYAAPARLPARCHLQAAALRPAELGACTTTKHHCVLKHPVERTCSAAQAAHAQQKSRSKKQRQLPLTPARPRHLLQTTPSLLRATTALAGPCLQQQEQACSPSAQYVPHTASTPSAHSAVQQATSLAPQSPSPQFCCCTHSKQARSATRLALLPLLVPALPPVQLAPAAATAGMPHAYTACTAGHKQQCSVTTHSRHAAGQTACNVIGRGRATTPQCTAALPAAAAG